MFALFINAAILIMAAGDVPRHRPRGRRRHRRRLPAALAAARHDDGERAVRGGAALLGAERHAHRHARRPDRDGRLPQPPAPPVAAPADHARSSPSSRRSSSSRSTASAARARCSSSARCPQPAAAVRGVPARDVHERSRTRWARSSNPCWLKALAWRVAVIIAVLNVWLLVSDRSPACELDADVHAHPRRRRELAADATILAHVARARAADRRRARCSCTSPTAGRRATSIELKLRESEEMKADRAYLERLRAELAAQGLHGRDAARDGRSGDRADPRRRGAAASISSRCPRTATASSPTSSTARRPTACGTSSRSRSCSCARSRRSAKPLAPRHLPDPPTCSLCYKALRGQARAAARARGRQPPLHPRHDGARGRSSPPCPGWGGVAMGVDRARHRRDRRPARRSQRWLAGLARRRGRRRPRSRSSTMTRKARRLGAPLLGRAPARRFALAYLPPLVAGTVLTAGVRRRRADRRGCRAAGCCSTARRSPTGGALLGARRADDGRSCFMALGAAAFAAPARVGRRRSWPPASAACTSSSVSSSRGDYGG